MPMKFDIFKKTGNSAVWIEEVEDISQARKRLASLVSSAPAEYRVFDQSLQQFVEVTDDLA
jgi:hypothetical protein